MRRRKSNRYNPAPVPAAPETWRQDFASLAECLTFARREPEVALPYRTTRADHGRGWCNGVSFEGALALAEGGWIDGVQKMQAIAQRLYDTIAPRATVYQNTEHALVGAMLDIGAYVMGEPECMLDFVASEAKAPRHVDIMVNISAASLISTDTIINRGAAILACIEVLEHSGCTVAVSVASCSRDRHRTIDIRACVKSPGVPMDTDRLAFVLAHPAMLRRIILAC